MDVEVVRLDGERLLELELVRRVVHVEIEILEDGDEDKLDFLPREGATLKRRVARELSVDSC